MELRELEDVERGCGRLRKRLCYARGETGPNGSLQAATLYAGINHSVGDLAGNLFFDMPARKMVEIDLPLTLLCEELIDELQGSISRQRAPQGRPANAALWPHIWNLPVYAVADHIGLSQKNGKGYTAWTFGAELKLHGPNRAIPPELAMKLAQRGAVPVVFTSADVPFFDSREHAEWFLRACVGPYAQAEHETGRLLPGPAYRAIDFMNGVENRGFNFEPTWQHNRFTLRRGGYDGIDHYILACLWYLSETRDTFGIELREAPVWGSWFTNIIYTADGPNDPNIEDMINAGIEPVMIRGASYEDEAEDGE